MSGVFYLKPLKKYVKEGGNRQPTPTQSQWRTEHQQWETEPSRLHRSNSTPSTQKNGKNVHQRSPLPLDSKKAQEHGESKLRPDASSTPHPPRNPTSPWQGPTTAWESKHPHHYHHQSQKLARASYEEPRSNVHLQNKRETEMNITAIKRIDYLGNIIKKTQLHTWWMEPLFSFFADKFALRAMMFWPQSDYIKKIFKYISFDTIRQTSKPSFFLQETTMHFVI